MQLSQSGLSQFLEALPDPALVLDGSAYIRLANGAAHSLFGYAPGELATRTIQTIVPGLRRVGHVCSARRKGGSTIRIDIRANPIAVEGESLTLCTLRDVTQPATVATPARRTMERHRRTLDQMLEGCQIIGFDWRYLYVNDAVCRHGRKTQAELLGHTMMEVYPGIDATPVFAAIRRCMEERTPITVENEFRYADATSGWFEVSIQPVPEGVLVLSIECTAKKRAERETERQLDHLKALRQIDLAIIGSSEVHDSLRVVLHEVTTQLTVDAAAILLLDPHSQMLGYAAGRGFRSRAIERSKVRLGEGIAGRAALERLPLIVADLAQAGDRFVRKDLLQPEAFVAYHAIPLVAKGVVHGVLELFHRAPLEPEPAWLDFRDALAGQAAIALDNAHLFSGLARANADLLLAYDTTIEGWSRALDLRDQETLGHTIRVTELALDVARLAGMVDAELVQVRRGALLHDIGKMGVPDEILLKPGPLTDAEMAIMRQHPVVAYELLRPIAYLRAALDIPYCHHEKWDGTGYPRGLAGDEIPLAARLFAVVDVWDALRSDRPYRSGWPEDRVLEHLRKGAGTHFDPRAVEAFFQIIEDHRDTGSGAGAPLVVA